MWKRLISALSYIAIVFPLAFFWHLGPLKDMYAAFGYFSGAPNIAAGFASIVIQGVALSLIYPLFHTGAAGFARAFQFAGLMGLFFWTSHVLALVAKQNVPGAAAFIALETAYLAVQFGLFAVALGWIYRRA